MGLYASYKRRDTLEGKFLMGVFICTLACQVHDFSVFQQVAGGVYYVKWYALFLDRFREAKIKILLKEKQIKQMRIIHEATVGVAHGLEEPFKCLEMAFNELKRNPDNKEFTKSIRQFFSIQKNFWSQLAMNLERSLYLKR